MVAQTPDADATDYSSALTRGHKKKARTRQQLLEAALRIYGRKGVGELALNELAEEAGVSNGTIYNYFRTREEVLEAVGIALAEELSHQVAAISKGVTLGAERTAIGIRAFILRAQEDEEWAKALVSVVDYAQGMQSALTTYVREDLSIGLLQGDFTYADIDLAITMVLSATIGAIKAIVVGKAVNRHDSILAEMILMALGLPAKKAKGIANLPLPQPV